VNDSPAEFTALPVPLDWQAFVQTLPLLFLTWILQAESAIKNLGRQM